MLAANDQNGFLPCERARWVTGGNVYFDTLKKLIQEAEKSLSVYFYIIANDTTGNQILELLRQAARRGVEVRLLIDDFASDEIDQEIEQSLVASGIHFHRFEPLFSTSNTYIGRRMHAKVVIADGVKALVAGINVADRYHGTATEKPWLDYGIYIEGPSSQVLEKWGATLSQPFLNIRHPKWSLFPHEDQYPDPKSIWTRVTVNDFAKNRKEITRSYNNALRKAEKSVTIVGGYFLPGRKFRRLLRQAAARGVSVNVIVTGISDVPITRLAAEYLYGRLLRSGIRIFEYQGAMLHGKAAVIDKTWLTIGSYNQNPLSAYLSIEVNVDVVNSALASDFQSHLDHIIQNESQEVTLEGYHLKSDWLVRLKRWIAYRLVKWSLRLLFLASKVETDDD